MARLNQFYKGEDIKITINYDADAGFAEYDAQGNPLYDEQGNPIQLNFCLLVYPDTLDLTNATNRADKIARINTNDDYDTINNDSEREISETPYWRQNVDSESGIPISVTFVIPYGKTKTLDSGDYTIELVYGNDDARKILRQNRSFTLVDSAGEYVENIVPQP